VKEKFNVALAQISCKAGDKNGNLKKAEKSAIRAQKEKADLLILPELSLTGYVVRDQVYELAEQIPGESTNYVERIAKKTGLHIIFGMPEISKNTRATLHNTAVLVNPNGVMGKYRKMYLPTHSVFEEKRYFRPGYKSTVISTNFGNIGLVICYDIFFPEVTRLTRLDGAQLIVCISASPAIRRNFFEVLTAARAMENTAYLAFVNLAGIEDGLQFWGGSRLIAPNGKILVQAKYDEEDFVTHEIDYADVKSVEPFVPTLKDLRPELFDKLKKSAEDL
jgi:predicted amidohydrolase